MKRLLTYLVGPEIIMLLVSAWVWGHCLLHPSGEGRDVEVLERTLMLLPLCVTPLVFATVFVPGARTWLWLCRANVALFSGLILSAWWLVSGFGSGAKGQDAGFIMVLAFGIVLASFGSAITGVMILAAKKPGFAQWFHAHRFLGVLGTLAAALPFGLAVSVVLGILIGVIGGVYTLFQK